MPIQITQQPISLEITKSPARLSQRNNGKLVLDIETQGAKVEMRTKLPKIQIDQSEAFAEAGKMDNNHFLSDNVSYSRQKFQEGLIRIVDQGNDLKEIQNGSDPIPEHAVYNAYDMFMKEFNLGTVPQSRPSITLDRGEVTYQYNPASVVNRTVPQKIEINYTPYQVNVAVRQYNSIHFSYEKPKFDFMV